MKLVQLNKNTVAEVYKDHIVVAQRNQALLARLELSSKELRKLYVCSLESS
jgi:hypothetical protein